MVNVAVCVHQEVPKSLPEDIKMIRVLSFDTRKLCWSNKPLKYFFTVKNDCAPCISVGTSQYCIGEALKTTTEPNLGTLHLQNGTGNQKWMD